MNKWRLTITLFLLGIALLIFGFLTVIAGVPLGFFFIANGGILIGMSIITVNRENHAKNL